MNKIINFGNYKWKVLYTDKNKSLIITEEITELRWYNNKFIDVTWYDCELRRYLNNDFYNKFSLDEKSKIIKVINTNPDNPWFKTNGGLDTVDNIFLLSIEEVCKYFGDSSEKLLNKKDQKWSIEDENNLNRQAAFKGINHSWRLRSPGYYNKTSTSIGANGNIYIRGNGVFGSPRDGGGVRPALWVKSNT